jgi:hypothetical protein
MAPPSAAGGLGIGNHDGALAVDGRREGRGHVVGRSGAGQEHDLPGQAAQPTAGARDGVRELARERVTRRVRFQN